MKALPLIAVLLVTSICIGQSTKLLRQPSVHNNQVVFVYANDLWSSTTNGGTAKRLTSHEGYESNPHFSPDGRHIAFTAQYDGNIDVYVMEATGGTPERLTYHPGGDFVQGWTPEGAVLFRSTRESKPTETSAFYSIKPGEAYPEKLPLSRAAYGDISADGTHVAYTPITSWDPEWRNYRGGQAMPIWIVNLKTLELETTPQLDKERHLDPVWLDGQVYYLSERDYTSNIWRYDPNTKKEEQVTFHKKYDVKSLDADRQQIIYEQGGMLHMLNPQTKATRPIEISVKADLNYSRTRWETAKGSDLTNASISPNGKRAVFEHRGEIFSVPREEGTYRNLTQSSHAADRSPSWSPDGQRIAYFSDASGEYQLMIADQKGTVLKRISFKEPTFYFKPTWSPDGKHLAYTDTHYNLWITDVSKGSNKQVDTDSYAHPNRTFNPVWSPDSRYVAYPKQQKSHFKAIYAYDLESDKVLQLSAPLGDAIAPTWSEKGKYLYTLVSTDYGLNSGWLDMSSYDPQVNRSLYAIVLDNKSKAPVLPMSDEEEPSEDQDTDKKKEKKEDQQDEVSVVVDTEGIYERIIPLQLPSDNYTSLTAGPEGTLFVGRTKDNNTSLHTYSIKDEKLEEYASNVSSFVMSDNRKHLLMASEGQWYIADTKGKLDKNEDRIDTQIRFEINPRQEYKQMFKEGWRFMRDFLYVDNIHGAPWDKVYEWYAPWIDHVRHRTDLNYVVDIMSGEVAIGHSYVFGGDLPDVDRVSVGLLGADLKKTKDGYQITKIYNGEHYNPGSTGPLAAPGLNVKEGDYITHINGKALDASTNPYALLEQTADRNIYINVSSNANSGDTREILVAPIPNEGALRYLDWVEGNRRKVDEMSGGKLAYVYVPNTGGPGFTSFNRYYFSQQDKQGVVIDERNNGGGSAADYIIDILKREPMGYFNSKASDRRPWTTPMAGIFGPKVMIINERAGSGGDLLPYMFKQQDLGTLVGTRTWGGLVGTWDTPRFIDGGGMIAPRGGFYDLDGNWAVEGVGVAPDIEVIQHPKLVAAGEDPQLERAVQEALKRLEDEKFEYQPEPEAPVRWKRPDGYDKDGE